MEVKSTMRKMIAWIFSFYWLQAWKLVSTERAYQRERNPDKNHLPGGQ